MDIVKTTTILDDNGIDIKDKISLFHLRVKNKKHKLDGAYGVSSAERDPGGFYEVISDIYLMGIYEGNSIITEFNYPYTEHFNIENENVELIDIKIVDSRSFAREYFENK